jgi:hypothetical protein
MRVPLPTTSNFDDLLVEEFELDLVPDEEFERLTSASPPK